MLQRRFVGAQLFELVLGEVADVQRLGFLALAALLGDGAGQQLDQRRFAGAVAAEQADAAAGAQRHADVVDDLAVDVAGRGFFDAEQRVGQGGRLAEAEMEGRIDVGGGDHFHAFQRLDPALRLAGLGGLGLEALDEAGQVGDFALLRFVGRLLGGEPGGAGAFVVGIAAAGQRQALEVDGEDLADHGVEEIAVVRNQQQRRRRVLQPAFEPEHGVEVEVVGRLVEQQQVGAAGQGAGEVEAHPPAAGEIGHRAREIGVGEAEAVQHFGDAGLGRIAADFAVAGVQVADRLAVALGFGFDQFAFDAAQFDVAVEHEIEGGIGQGRRFLGDAGDVPAGRHFDIAGFGVQFVGEQREEAGFAAAVGADDADLPAGVELDGGVDDQRAAGAGEGDLAEGDHEAGGL